MTLYANGGYSLDLTLGVLSRAVDHGFNCYNFPNVSIKGYAMKTNTPSNTAFRGFGGPQVRILYSISLYLTLRGCLLPKI